jgi:hypothetical protein
MTVLSNGDMLAVMSFSSGTSVCDTKSAVNSVTNTTIQNNVETLIPDYKNLPEMPVLDKSGPSVDVMTSVRSEVVIERAMLLSAFLHVKRNSLLNCKYFEKKLAA